tara:strand:+ start:118 stop:372 length:255 start_codon:yes stop_codon:yes gene_type:complete
VDKSVSSAEVKLVVEGEPMVERAVLFDVYEGEGIPVGKSSLAYRLYFRSADRTLSSEEVNQAMGKTVKSLERELKASLRTGAIE